jgi:hypothetical protein
MGNGLVFALITIASNSRIDGFPARPEESRIKKLTPVD